MDLCDRTCMSQTMEQCLEQDYWQMREFPLTCPKSEKGNTSEFWWLVTKSSTDCQCQKKLDNYMCSDAVHALTTSRNSSVLC